MVDDHDARERQEPAGQPWSLEHPLGDPDAWRGGSAEDDADAWRASPALDEWPEWDAGPEYLMWKRIAEEGR